MDIFLLFEGLVENSFCLAHKRGFLPDRHVTQNFIWVLLKQRNYNQTVDIDLFFLHFIEISIQKTLRHYFA